MFDADRLALVAGPAILRNNPRDIGQREFKDAFEEQATAKFERSRLFGTAFT